MAQADSARSSVLYKRETTWADTGLDAASVANMKELRITGHTLSPGKETRKSAEIRADRQVPGIIEVFQKAGGGIDFELSHQALDDFFESALHSTWSTNTVTGSSDLTFAASTKTITSAGSPSFNTKYVVGQYIQVKGTTNNGTNSVPKYFKITAVTATVITVAESLTNENNTSAVIAGSMVRNGTTETSYGFERGFADVSQFLQYVGMELDTMDLNFEAKEIVTGSMAFMGKLGARRADTIASSTVDAPTAEVMNASANVGTITEGGASLSTAIKSIKLSIKNNLRERPAIGTKYSVSIGRGRFFCDGSLTAYWESGDLYDKFLAHTQTSLHFRITDDAGNCIFFTIPAIRLTNDPVPAPAADQDVMEEITWEAHRDTTTNCMMQIDKFAA